MKSFLTFLEESDPCWKGYKQLGTKKKNGTSVPNCIPVEEDSNVSKNKKLNKPFRTPGGPKKFSVYVKDGDSTKKVNFGDPNMSIKRDEEGRKKSFRARHNCDEKKDKTKAGYWSCKFWDKKPVTDLLKDKE